MQPSIEQPTFDAVRVVTHLHLPMCQSGKLSECSREEVCSSTETLSIISKHKLLCTKVRANLALSQEYRVIVIMFFWVSEGLV